MPRYSLAKGRIHWPCCSTQDSSSERPEFSLQATAPGTELDLETRKPNQRTFLAHSQGCRVGRKAVAGGSAQTIWLPILCHLHPSPTPLGYYCTATTVQQVVFSGTGDILPVSLNVVPCGYSQMTTAQRHSLLTLFVKPLARGGGQLAGTGWMYAHFRYCGLTRWLWTFREASPASLYLSSCWHSPPHLPQIACHGQSPTWK